jgi:hypothetical protein
MAFEITKQEIIKQAIALNTLWKQTRDQKYRDEELRLRRIALELENTVIGGTGVTKIIAGTGVTISPVGGTGDVTINATATTPDLQEVTDEGNTTTNAIETGGTKSDYFSFDTTATPTPTTGMMFWDQDSQTPDVQLDSQLAAKMFQDEFWYVKNQTGSTIPKGTVVMAVGTLGASSRILVAPMIANGSVSAKYILGIAAENIPDGGDGSVMRAGKIRQLNTTAFTAGDVLYANPAVAGGLTNVLPSAPNLKLAVAFVVHSATNGVLAVRVEIGSDLYEDHRVQVTSPTDGQLLRYDNTDQRWENWTPNFLTTVPTLDQVTDAGNTTTNPITVNSLTINNGTYNASIGFGLINNPTGNFFDVFFANNTGLRFGSPSFDGSAFQAFGGLHASFAGQMYFDYGSQQRTIANRSANFRNASSTSPVTVMKLTDTSNVLIGTTTDAGYKLDVNGNTRISGTIEATGGDSSEWNQAYSWGDHSTAGYITGTTGFTGVFTIPTNPPGQQNLDIQNGLIINVF